jgi:hypothetical protein
MFFIVIITKFIVFVPMVTYCRKRQNNTEYHVGINGVLLFVRLHSAVKHLKSPALPVSNCPLIKKALVEMRVNVPVQYTNLLSRTGTNLPPQICKLILRLLQSRTKQTCSLQHSSSFVRSLTALNIPLSTFAKPTTDSTGGYIIIVSKNIFTCKPNQLTINL